MIKKELTSRKKQAMEMRSRIQAVALELFDKEGFENVSVEQIAQAAGCSVGNIYHYFKSKDELVIQVTSSVDAQYSVLEESYLADEANSWHDKLLDFVGQALVISANDPSLYRSFIHGIPSRASCGITKSACTSGCCGSWWTAASRRALSTPGATGRSWWPIWWRCTGVCCWNGAFTRGHSICPAGDGAWPPRCWRAGGTRRSKGIHRKGGADG